MKDKCGIYSITNVINDKLYIGQSKHCYQRFKQHKSSLNKCGAIYLAIKKYGIENFEFNILEECDISELDNLEELYISMLDTIAPNGYNLNSGGNANKVMSEETRKKMSERQLGEKNHMYGKSMSDETKEKLSKALKGRIITDEWKEKITIANTGKNIHMKVTRKIDKRI